MIKIKCNCFECPLGIDDYKRYLDICDKLQEETNCEEISQSIWCDKVGGKCGWFGYCEDAFDKDIKQSHKANKKRSTKRTRRERYNKRLKYLYEFSNYPNPSMLITEKWDRELKRYVSIDKPYYTRCYIGRRTKYFKRYSNKKVRRCKGDIKSGNNYRKIYDYWWVVI